ncbi:MAG: glutamine amidotransferase-related protein [Alphaproteobacteria bacterium]
MSKSAVIFIHAHHESPGTMLSILEDAGFGVNTRFTPQDSIDDVGPDLLVVMGGPQGVYETNKYPYLQKEMDIIAARLREDKPTLGICLGSQLMAGALGANVYKGKQGPEIGWHDITVKAPDHPLRQFDSTQTKMMHWHADTFDLPPGAALRASSDLYKNQAFSYRKNAMAIQGHPEVDQKLALAWIEKMDENDLMSEGETLAQAQNRLRAETKIFSAKLAAQMRLFMGEWLALTGVI